MEIDGKNILITGSSKRVGRKIAVAFAKSGGNIIGHYHTSKDDAKEAELEIKSFGVDCHFFSADLSKTSEVHRLIKDAFDKFRTIDVLINSASIFYKTPLSTVTENNLDELMTTNFKAPFILAKEIGLKMFARGHGKIINIADWSAFRPYKDYAPYCASKAALVTFTKSLARDLAPKVMATAIAPGPVMLPPHTSKEEELAIAKLTALGRIGNPEDVANAAIFLAENDFMNGTVLVVDGGRSIV